MKRKIITFFVIFSATFCLLQVFCSCNKIEEKYSCDPAVDEWVRDNLKTIQSMNRQDLIQLEPEKQRAAFRALSPVQRYNCWVDKLEQVKKLEWTDKESAHLCLLSETMKLEWFDDASKNDKEYSDQIDVFLKKWVNDGMDYFGWTKDELGRMVATLMDVEIENQNVVLKTVSVGGGASAGGGDKPLSYNCNCSRSSDWCGNSEECAKITCTIGSGCGTIWRYDCDGRCRNFTPPK
jgi:hypothetical protein